MDSIWNKDMPVNFVCPEYSGYGLRANEARETQKGCLDMADAAYEFCKSIGKAVIVAGFSVGSGPACYLAQRYGSEGRLYGLVLINPFVSIKRLCQDKVWFVFLWLLYPSENP